MAFLHLTFDNFEFRDLGHSDFLSFEVLAPTLINICLLTGRQKFCDSRLYQSHRIESKIPEGILEKSTIMRRNQQARRRIG